MSSLQHKLAALRGPYIPMMTLDVEVGGAVEKRELPFVVGVLADFGGAAAELADSTRRPSVYRDRPRQLR